MKTATRVQSVNELHLFASLFFLWGRHDPPLYCDVAHASRNRPTHDPHVTHDPPRRAFNVGCGEAQRMKNYCGKIPPRLPVHHFGPGPTTLHAYVWPRPRHSCWCTKVGALLLTPLLVHEHSEPRGAATLSRAEEGSRREAEARGNQGNAKTRNTKSKRARWAPPERSLPAWPLQPRQEPCRGNLPDTSGARFP